MSAQSARGYLGISEVLAELRGEFSDISVSKIRFLETEGLITPARSPSGYRRFGWADVDRLRYILAAQRDQYLPLRVIKERLARLETADEHAGPGGGGQSSRAASGGRQPGLPEREASGGRLPEPPERRASGGRPSEPLSRRELVEAAGLTEALLTELETFGLLRRIGRQFAPEALQVAKAAVALTAYGVEARHLRAVRAAAERETTMIESLVAPILRQRAPGAQELASRTAAELADLVLLLHGALVEGTLAEAGLNGVPARLIAGPALERGAEGASA